MIKVQVHSKDISKIVHVTSGVQLSFYELSRILFVCKENKNNDFIEQFFSSSAHMLWCAAIMERVS